LKDKNKFRMAIIHRSKIDYSLLLISVFPIFIAGFFMVFMGKSTILILGIFLMILAVFIALSLFNIYYVIAANELKIKAGFFNYNPILIKDIKEIKITNSLLSSPAASLDRILLRYNKFDEIILSPKDKFQFVKDLIAINPLIQNKIIER
jgi:hypothetical protein